MLLTALATETRDFVKKIDGYPCWLLWHATTSNEPHFAINQSPSHVDDVRTLKQGQQLNTEEITSTHAPDIAGKWFSTSSHFMMENTIDELGPC